jgi:glycosyltransferase involved in cell wall biosynthesis
MAAQTAPLWVKAGHEVVVYTVGNHPEKITELNGVAIRYIFNPEKRLGLSGQFIYDFLCILDARAQNFDVILQLGYTTSGIWSFLWPKHKTITNMDGLEHQRAKYAGPLASFLKWSERRAAKRSKLLIADNPEIANYLSKYKVPISTIAYGSEIIEEPADAKELLQRHHFPTDNFHLHIGRIQPDNHVFEILDAAVNSRETLVTVGDYTTRYGRKLKATFPEPNIIYAGTIYDKTILNALRTRATFYLHGHSVGGTNPALLEAMGSGSMVLAHENPFNASVLGGLGALWKDEEVLTRLLTQRPSMEIRSEQARLSRERIKTHFNWEDVAKNYLKSFASLK